MGQAGHGPYQESHQMLGMRCVVLSSWQMRGYPCGWRDMAGRVGARNHAPDKRRPDPAGCQRQRVRTREGASGSLSGQRHPQGAGGLGRGRWKGAPRCCPPPPHVSPFPSRQSSSPPPPPQATSRGPPWGQPNLAVPINMIVDGVPQCVNSTVVAQGAPDAVWGMSDVSGVIRGRVGAGAGRV